MRIDVGAAIALVGVAVAWAAFNASSGADDREPAVPTAAAAPAAPAPATSPMGEGLAPTRDAGTASSAGPALGPVAAASAPAPASSAGHEVPAAWNLADSRVAGDDRAPPIERAKEEAATPAWQLDNHQAYAQREQDRHQAVQRAFVDAADRELPQLDRQIEQGRAMGIPPDQLAKGEEKRRRIAEMRERMQANLAASAPAP